MDFIKNLHISDIASDKNKTHGQAHTDTTPAPPPPTAIGASHPSSGDKQGTSASTLFDKIGDALSGHVEHKASTTTAPIAPTSAPVAANVVHHKEDLFSKIGDALSGGKQTLPPAAAPVAHAPVPTGHKEENILHKLGDVLGGSKTPSAPAPAPVPVAAPHKEENLLSKLGDALSGRKTPPPAPAPVVAPKDENILHKLGDALSGRKTPPPPPPPAPVHQNIVDKLTEAVTGKKADHHAEPAKPQSIVGQLSEVVLKKDENKVVEKPHGLVDKVNSVLGGGSKAEAQEGRLDKAIDMFQEHVLKQGPQNNESAIEQAKDKEIANMIRNAVGKEKK